MIAVSFIWCALKKHSRCVQSGLGDSVTRWLGVHHSAVYFSVKISLRQNNNISAPSFQSCSETKLQNYAGSLPVFSFLSFFFCVGQLDIWTQTALFSQNIKWMSRPLISLQEILWKQLRHVTCTACSFIRGDQTSVFCLCNVAEHTNTSSAFLLSDGVHSQWTTKTNILDCCSQGHRLWTDVAPDGWSQVGH